MGAKIVQMFKIDCDRCPERGEFHNQSRAAMAGWTKVDLNENKTVWLCPNDRRELNLFLGLADGTQ